LLYTLEQGPREKKILQDCYRQKRPIPSAIQNAPVLFLGLELYYDAFFDLQSCRSVGMAEGPISWISIYDYAARNQFSEGQHDDLHYFISRMDAAYLKHREKESKKR